MKGMIDFTKSRPVVEPPSLLGMQKASFEAFLQKDVPAQERKKKGLQGIFKYAFPVKSHNKKLVLDFVEYRFNEPRYSAEKCKEEELTYSLPLYVKLRLTNKESEKVTEEEVYIADFPSITKEETFVINGAERIIISQLQRSPGLFFEENASIVSGDRTSYRARVIPERGNWLDFEVKNNLLFVSINRRRRFLATLFIRAMGGLPSKVLKEFTNPLDKKILEESFKQDGANSEEEALLQIYQRIRSEHSSISQSAKEVFYKRLIDPRHYDLVKAGRFQINKELGLDTNWELEILLLNDIV